MLSLWGGTETLNVTYNCSGGTTESSSYTQRIFHSTSSVNCKSLTNGTVFILVIYSICPGCLIHSRGILFPWYQKQTRHFSINEFFLIVARTVPFCVQMSLHVHFGCETFDLRPIWMSSFKSVELINIVPSALVNSVSVCLRWSAGNNNITAHSASVVYYLLTIAFAI